MDGLITQGEKYNKVVDAWSSCSDTVADAMMKEISSVQPDQLDEEKQLNSVYMMSHSGARGSPAQMKQHGGFIPGIRPGKKTAEYIDNILTRVTLPGSFALALVKRGRDRMGETVYVSCSNSVIAAKITSHIFLGPDGTNIDG